MKIPAILKNPTVITWLVVGGLGLYAFYRFRKATSTPDQGDTAKEDAAKLIASGQTPSYSDTVYVGFADKIETAGMLSAGTDEESIYRVFSQMKNDVDVLKLIRAFGNRRMEFSLAWGSLSAWLDGEMNASEIAKINAILETNGIKYRF